MSQPITYRQIHGYMLQKPREYYKKPLYDLVKTVMEEQKGKSISYEQAEKW